MFFIDSTSIKVSLDANKSRNTQGQSIGLYNEIRTSKVVTNNEYLAVMYNKKAQEFIVNNLKIINNEEIHINNID